MRATMTILGLYNYDNTIFDNFNLPEGVDKETVVANILSECANLEIIYPNPDIFSAVLKHWSNLKLFTWNRIWKVLQLEYNPLENYNRKDHFKTEQDREDTVTSEGSGTSNETYKVSAYDSEDFANREKNDGGYSNNSTSTDKGKITTVNEGGSSGNIGVTTSQQMLEAEIEVAKHNIAEIIVENFKDKFCIEIY